MSYPESNARYDYGAAISALIFSVGVYVDGWAHNRFDDIESFFTPWHAVLYTGFLMIALYLVIPAFRNIRAGKAWQHSLPRGYATSLVGVAIFFFSGLWDMVWHTLFGIEVNIDAFMSPPHLALFASSLLIATGPVRAIVARNAADVSSWAENGAFVIALLAVLGTFSFVLQPWIANGSSEAATAFGPHGPRWTAAVTESASAPVVSNVDAGGLHIEETSPKSENGTLLAITLHRLGVAGIMIQVALFAGFMLYMIKIGRVPRGAFTVLLFVNTALVTEMRAPQVVPDLVLPQMAVGLLAGILADALYAWLRPSAANVRGLYSFAVLAPAGFYALYFAAMHLFAGGSWWSQHIVAGSIVYAGAIGAALATLVVRPEQATS